VLAYGRRSCCCAVQAYGRRPCCCAVQDRGLEHTYGCCLSVKSSQLGSCAYPQLISNAAVVVVFGSSDEGCLPGCSCSAWCAICPSACLIQQLLTMHVELNVVLLQAACAGTRPASLSMCAYCCYPGSFSQQCVSLKQCVCELHTSGAHALWEAHSARKLHHASMHGLLSKD
jgi:hypothetical protein